MKEIKKGNIAVGILMATIVLSIANIVQAGVENLTALITPSDSLATMSLALLVGVLQLLVVLLVAVFSISVALKVLEKITTDIDEMKELKRGNVAVAILMSGVLLSVSFVIRAGTAGLVKAIDPSLLSFYLGV